MSNKLEIVQDGKWVCIWDMRVEFENEIEAKKFIMDFIIKRINEQW